MCQYRFPKETIAVVYNMYCLFLKIPTLLHKHFEGFIVFPVTDGIQWLYRYTKTDVKAQIIQVFVVNNNWEFIQCFQRLKAFYNLLLI